MRGPRSVAEEMEPTDRASVCLRYDKSTIDQTLTTYFQSPKSFTGENMVEISCHGSNAVIKKITKELIKKGFH